MVERIINDENHQGVKRIYGVPTPYLGHEAVNKDYVDEALASFSGGSSGIIDGGAPDTDYTDGPIIDCGEIT